VSSVQVALKIVYPFNRSLVGCSRCGKRCVRSTVGTIHTARGLESTLEQRKNDEVIRSLFILYSEYNRYELPGLPIQSSLLSHPILPVKNIDGICMNPYIDK